MANSKPVAVLQVISSSDFLGAERVVAELARQSNAGRVRMTIGVISASPQVAQRMAGEIGRADIEVVPLHSAGRFDWSCVRAIAALIDRHRVQVVHAHNYKSDFYALAARLVLRRRVRLLASSHTWKLTATSERVYKYLDLKVLRGFDAIAAISEPIRQEILAAGIRPERVTIVDNGIDLDALNRLSRPEARALLGCGETDFVAGSVASLTPEKGHLDLLAAVREARAEIPGLRVVLAGDGPMRPAIEEYIREKGLASCVQLLGARSDVRSLYSGFDVFVLASHDEGLPMVLLEAMGSGVPPIATAVGAVPRLLEGGDRGILVKAHEPATVRDALVALHRDRSRRLRLGACAQSVVRAEFSSRRMAEKYEVLYCSLAS